MVVSIEIVRVPRVLAVVTEEESATELSVRATIEIDC